MLSFIPLTQPKLVCMKEASYGVVGLDLMIKVMKLEAEV
jgi:hypothetical protein